MGLWHLTWREIKFRRTNFLLSLAAATVAVAAAVAIVGMLRAQQLRTEHQLGKLDDEIRKITKNMGFNILILPKNQNLVDFHANDFAEQTMPEEYVHRIAEAPEVVTVAHLRPALVRKVEWREQGRPIILMGVRGVVPLLHQNPKKPLAEPVPPGKIQLGSALAREYDLKIGQPMLLNGETFEIEKIFAERGTKDDITAWIDLPAAQQMAGLPGRINIIQALECNCSSIDRLAEIQSEIGGILGDEVQVIELASQAIARAKARNEVAAEAASQIAWWRRFAGTLIPLVVLASGIWIGLLLMLNVRERRNEIGLWRALGWRTPRILGLIVGKALLIGLLGALLGGALGTLAAIAASRSMLAAAEIPATALLLPTVLLIAVGIAPLLTGVASWLPAVAAARQDPADALRED